MQSLDLVNIDPEIIIQRAAEMLAEKAWQHIEAQLDQMICLDLTRAAASCSISPSQFRRAMTHHIDFGDKCTRVTLAQVNQVVKSRTVKSK